MAEPATGTALRVLLIDDDRALGPYHAALLRETGLAVDILMHPHGTMHALQTSDPDLIILDLHMPDMSGTEVATLIRTQHHFDDIPIILISSDENKDLIARAIQCGFAGFYKKPLDPQLFPATAMSLARGAHNLKQARHALGQALAEVQEQRSIAEKASQAKSDFLSSMSHELRTPMNAVIGFSQLLQLDDKLTSQQRMHAGEHLMQLINDVLDLAKIEAGALEVTQDTLHLDELISECLNMIEPIARKTGIRLNQYIASGALVSADRIRTKQVLINLLSNAVKYNKPAGHVTVAVTYKNSCTRISVTDSGAGISKDQQKNLFKPFARLGAEKTAVEGTGIGLVISQHIATRMNGKIGCISDSGNGATFWLDLPKA